MSMETSDYLKHAGTCLSTVEAWLEGFDPDELDYTPADGVVTLEFGDGTRFVLNRQSAASQMWFAAGARAWHFDWDAARAGWFDDKEGRELFVRIGEAVSQQLGRTVRLEG
jgi:CyaY protein